MENSYLAVSVRESFWLYPALEIIHIIGIVLLVGAAFMFDLRLLGFSKQIPVHDLAEHLLPWSQRGLWLIIPSGLLLFITNAEALGFNSVFWTKILLILIGGLNAYVFHRTVSNNFSTTGSEAATAQLKVSAILSVLVWISVIICGRMLAY